MATLLKSGAQLIKADFVYELGMNELTGIIELREVGKSCIGKRWAQKFYDIPVFNGKQCWLTRDELEESSGKRVL